MRPRAARSSSTRGKSPTPPQAARFSASEREIIAVPHCDQEHKDFPLGLCGGVLRPEDGQPIRRTGRRRNGTVGGRAWESTTHQEHPPRPHKRRARIRDRIEPPPPGLPPRGCRQLKMQRDQGETSASLRASGRAPERARRESSAAVSPSPCACEPPTEICFRDRRRLPTCFSLRCSRGSEGSGPTNAPGADAEVDNGSRPTPPWMAAGRPRRRNISLL